MKRNSVLTIILAVGLFLLTGCPNQDQSGSENAKLKAELDSLKNALQMNGYDGYHSGGHGDGTKKRLTLKQYMAGGCENLEDQLQKLVDDGYECYSEPVNGQKVFFTATQCARVICYYDKTAQSFRGDSWSGPFKRDWVVKEIDRMKEKGVVPEFNKVPPGAISSIILYLNGRGPVNWWDIK